MLHRIFERSGRSAMALSLAGCLAFMAACVPTTLPTSNSGKRFLIPASTSGTVAAPTFQVFALEFKGTASLTGPVSGAKIRLVTLEGKPIIDVPTTTDRAGRFNFPIPAGLPEAFRLEVIGGQHDGKAFNGTLQAEFQNRSIHNPLLMVNAATTLAAAYRQTKGTTNAIARSAVANYLGMARSADVGLHLRNAALARYDHVVMTRSLLSQADFDTAIRAQVSAVDTVKARPGTVGLPSSFATKGLATDLIAGAGEKIISGALAQVGADAMGWGLSKMFGWPTDGQQLDQLKTQIQQVQAQLADVSNRLGQLETQMVNLQDSINDVKQMLVAMEQRENQQLGSLDYNGFADSVSSSLSVIDGYYQQLQWYMASDPTTVNTADVNTLRQAILTNVPVAMDHVHKALVGVAGSTSGLARWHKVVANSDGNYPTLVGNYFFDRLNNQFDYFRVAQLRGATLLVEAYHSAQPSPNTSAAQGVVDLWQKNVQAQTGLVYGPRVGFDVIVSPAYGVMWGTSPLSGPNNATTFTYDYPSATSGAQPSWMATAAATARAGGFSDWRVPNWLDAQSLPSNTSLTSGGAFMSQVGFAVDPNADAVWTSSYYDKVRDLFVGYWLNSNGIAAMGGTIQYQVFPARTFKVDSAAAAALGIPANWTDGSNPLIVNP